MLLKNMYKCILNRAMLGLLGNGLSQGIKPFMQIVSPYYCNYITNVQLHLHTRVCIRTLRDVWTNIAIFVYCL